MKLGLSKISDEIIVVYGSYASGDFDDNSDLDLLVIGEEKNLF